MQQDNKPDNKNMNSMGRPVGNKPEPHVKQPKDSASTAERGSQPKVKNQPK